MNTFSDALQHLINDRELSFHVEPNCSNPAGGPASNPDLAWYAAFRDQEHDAFTPERGWGYGRTPEEAIDAAVISFRANEDERAA